MCYVIWWQRIENQFDIHWLKLPCVKYTMHVYVDSSMAWVVLAKANISVK